MRMWAPPRADAEEASPWTPSPPLVQTPEESSPAEKPESKLRPRRTQDPPQNLHILSPSTCLLV